MSCLPSKRWASGPLDFNPCSAISCAPGYDKSMWWCPSDSFESCNGTNKSSLYFKIAKDWVNAVEAQRSLCTDPWREAPMVAWSQFIRRFWYFMIFHDSSWWWGGDGEWSWIGHICYIGLFSSCSQMIRTSAAGWLFAVLVFHIFPVFSDHPKIHATWLDEAEARKSESSPLLQLQANLSCPSSKGLQCLVKGARPYPGI